MSVRSVVSFVLKTVAIAIVLLIVMVVVSSIALPAETMEAAPQEAGDAMLRLLIVCVVDALILVLTITQSRWRGLPLLLGLIVAYYGTQTVVGQIEAISRPTEAADA